MREVEARLKISAVDRTGRVLQGVGDKLDQVNRRADQYNRSMTVMGRAQQSAFGLMARAGPIAAAAAAAGLVYSAKAAANFEESLYNIQKKSGATSEEMARLKGEIKDLATVMPVSVDEIASAFERGAAAGIPLDELKEFSRLAAGVADAWDTTSEHVGNVFAGFTAGMGLQRKELQAYASLINDLADSGIADETDIADFIDRAGASLKNFGMSPEEIAAYGAALLNLKMPAEVGARAMDTITGKLLAPENLSDKSFAAFEAIVGDVEKFTKLAGNQKLQFFLKQLEKMSSQRKASLLGALLGEGFDDEIMRLVSGSSELTRNLELARKHVANPSNSIIEAQTKKLELFNSQLGIMGNNVRVIATEIGDTILPSLTDAAKSINEMFDRSRDVSKGKAGQSPEELAQQRAWFFERMDEENADDPMSRRQKNLAYTEALSQVGAGQYKDIYDYVEHLKTVNRYAREENKPSVGRQGQPVVAYPGEEFPGGGGGYDLKNLPASGPVPHDRNAPSKAAIDALKDQYAYYGVGRETLQQYPNGDVRQAIGSSLDADPAVLKSVEKLDGGAQKMAESADQIGSAVRQAGTDFFASIIKAVAAMNSASEKLQNVKISGSAIGGMVGGSKPVKANTGRSMDPAVVGGPARNGGGGF